MPNVRVLIPARFQSSRFPGKPLSKILDKTMIQRVFENCAESGFDTYVVTDDQRIEDHVNEFGGKVIRVDDDVPSGTERIALAASRIFEDDVDLIINVQGDEPLLTAKYIQDIAKTHLDNNFEIMTMVKRRHSSHEFYNNPNVVKALFIKEQNKCLYFSRASIPFDRDNQGCDWFHHIGVYSYKPNALQDFAKASATNLEQIEKLEQLRAMELGMQIGAIEVDFEPLGVDTPEDIKRVEEVISEHK